MFINFCILTNVQALTAVIFEQNFWYRVCRVIYGRLTTEELQELYPNLENLVQSYQNLIQMNGVDLHVALNGITNYGEVVSSACETIATCYNNYYVENFESILVKYFIYIIRANYRASTIYLLNELLY